MTDTRVITPGSAAEFAAVRRGLGVTTKWLADRWHIAERSVQRWEAGTHPIDVRIAQRMVDLQELQETHVAANVEHMQTLPARDRVVLAVRHDEGDWTAGWILAVCLEVARRVPGTRIEWAGRPDADIPEPASTPAWPERHEDRRMAEVLGDMPAGELQVITGGMSVGDGRYASVTMGLDEAKALLARERRPKSELWIERVWQDAIRA